MGNGVFDLELHLTSLRQNKTCKPRRLPLPVGRLQQTVPATMSVTSLVSVRVCFRSPMGLEVHCCKHIFHSHNLIVLVFMIEFQWYRLHFLSKYFTFWAVFVHYYLYTIIHLNIVLIHCKYFMDDKNIVTKAIFLNIPKKYSKTSLYGRYFETVHRIYSQFFFPKKDLTLPSSIQNFIPLRTAVLKLKMGILRKQKWRWTYFQTSFLVIF